MGVIGILLIVALIFVVLNVAQWGIGILVSIVFWGIAGFLASRLMGNSGNSLLGNILLGIIGGAVGSFVLNLLNVGFVGDMWIVGTIIVGVIGGVIVIAIARALNIKL